MLRGAALRKKGAFELLLSAEVALAREVGLLGARSRCAVDATGFESQYVSPYYIWRSGRPRRRMTEWPKLTAATELRSHLMLGAHVCLGPCQDSPQFRPVIEQAARLQRIEQVLGDKGYDAEHNHRLCREQLGIRSTLIPPRRRWGGSRRWPTTPYRREMKSDFDKRALPLGGDMKLSTEQTRLLRRRYIM